jgi:hypothetical protein
MPKSIADLFAVPLEGFVAARNTLAKELKAAKQLEESAEVAALRKPSKTLWLVNQLARRHPKQLEAFIDATAKVRHAQQKGVGVREAMAAQRDALSHLTKLEPQADVQLLQSAAMSEPEALGEGRLLHEIEASGFDALIAAGVTAPPPPEPKKPTAAELKKQHELAKAKKHAEALVAKAEELEAKAAAARAAANEALSLVKSLEPQKH